MSAPAPTPTPAPEAAAAKAPAKAAPAKARAAAKTAPAKAAASKAEVKEWVVLDLSKRAKEIAAKAVAISGEPGDPEALCATVLETLIDVISAGDESKGSGEDDCAGAYGVISLRHEGGRRFALRSMDEDDAGRRYQVARRDFENKAEAPAPEAADGEAEAIAELLS